MRQRILDPVKIRRQLIIAPAHQHVADIAGDDICSRFDAGPFLRLHFLARADLQSALSLLLKQQRQAIEVGMRTGAPQIELVFVLGGMA